MGNEVKLCRFRVKGWFLSRIFVTRFAKRGLTGTVSGLTFHYRSTDTTIDKQFMLVPLPNLQQSTFTEASITGLSGVHGCLGCL